jgi:hypothetical protein
MTETNNTAVKGDARYLANHGRELINNGYAIVPIRAGTKSPGFNGWEKTKATPGMVREWLNNGFDDGGIGILTRKTPGVDIDVTEKRVADKIEAWCLENIGPAPIRYGKGCKRLLHYRCEEPFRKMKSGKYEDEWGEQHEIEILGDGQQFVAYAIHKDTGLPYRWDTEDQPLTIHAEDLTVITADQCRELLSFFVEICVEEGWERKTKGLSGNVASADSMDDPFADVETTIDISHEELREKLMLIPGADDYDRWVQIGMALFHQYAGEDTGLKLWHEWSEGADNYDAEALDKHWTSFNIDGKGRQPITARTILNLAKEATNEAIVLETKRLTERFITAGNLADWRSACIDVKHSEIDTLARVQVTDVAKRRYKEITGSNIPLAELRKQLSYEMKNAPDTPDWAKNWVYDSSCDKFFHTTWKTSVSSQGYNSMYGRYSLTKQDMLEGRVSPSKTPVDLTLNVYRAGLVYGQRYSPANEIIFKDGMVAVANTYIPCSLELPEAYTPGDKLAIARVKKHITHLLPDEWKNRIFTDWLAWVVQNPGKLVKWAMVLQGVPGDGKSFFGMLLRAVMGHTNVRMMNASVLESNFTGWAAGQCVAAIEEPRLHGQNRYDVLNKMKTFITNPIVEIHPKGQDSYDTENTTNYFMPTNFKDALPLDATERRYLVLFSQWQNPKALRDFIAVNPDYYINLYKTIEERAPALRKWLLNHEISEDFPAQQPAPQTDDFWTMVNSSTSDSMKVIDELIKEGKYPDISEDLLNITRLHDALLGEDVDIPTAQALNKLLENNGYTYLGRFVARGTHKDRFWSRNPDQFRHEGSFSVYFIKKFIKKRQAEIDDANEL